MPPTGSHRSLLADIPLRGRLKKRFGQMLNEYLQITLGILVTAIALDSFLIPNRLAAGGVSGLATVIHYLYGLPVGIQMVVYNLLLFALGTAFFGWLYGLKSVYGAFGLSLAVDLLEPVAPIFTEDAFLATLYGGILSGLGLGIVFRVGANTGGTDILAQVFHRYSNLGLGQVFLLIDFGVTVFAGYVFGARLALYGLIAVFVMGWVIDLLQEGITYEKAAFIISRKHQEIGEAILREIGRGATGIPVRGFFADEENAMVLSVVSRRELTALKELIQRIDPQSFMIIADVHEVIGEGFKGRRKSD